ncbi:MAG: 3-oxoacyl-[acyl-carrier-protein] synthase-1 [Oleiphilaceae bacterium]
MKDLDITITGIGMINPVGIGAPSTASAVMAGINQYSDSPIIRASTEPYKMAFVPEACLPDLKSDAPDFRQRAHKNSLYRRMLQLGKVALAEACDADKIDQPIPLFLAVPEQRCGRPFPALEPFIKDLSLEIDFSLDLLTSRVFPVGRSAGMNALSEAIKLLLSTPLESIIVGGVDSYMDVMLLGALDEERRLAGGKKIGGFVPGEGAAFVVLQKTVEPSLTVGHPAISEEPGHFYSEETCLGDGLSYAVKVAVDNSAASMMTSPIKTVLCSMNGEPMHGKEWGTSLVRNSDAFSDGFDMQHPAECYGDLGAATVPTLMGLSVLGLEKGNYQGPLLIWSASDREQRGAVVMSKNKGPSHG